MPSILSNFDNFSSQEEKVEFLDKILQKQIEQQLQIMYPKDQSVYRLLQILIQVKDFNFTAE